MATVSITGEDYPSYSDVETADLYLAADVSRAAIWAALEEDPDKGRALVTATRLLQRQSWVAGSPPDTEAVDLDQRIIDATALLAVDIILKPASGDGGGTGSNIKSVGGAGVPTITFFSPSPGNPLPQAAFDLLRGLIGPAEGSLDSAYLFGSAFGCSPYQRSRFDGTDYRLYGDGSPVEPC